MNVIEGFAARFKAYRLDHGWTLQQMANVTGVSVSAVATIENGRVTPHELTVHRIKKALPGLLDNEPSRDTAAAAQPAGKR